MATTSQPATRSARAPRRTEEQRLEHLEVLLYKRWRDLTKSQGYASTWPGFEPSATRRLILNDIATLESEAEEAFAAARAGSARDRATSCVFDDMTTLQCNYAMDHYYRNPQDLPRRRILSHVRASKPAFPIMVRFDENIFQPRSHRAHIKPQTEEPVSPKGSRIVDSPWSVGDPKVEELCPRAPDGAESVSASPTPTATVDQTVEYWNEIRRIAVQGG